MLKQAIESLTSIIKDHIEPQAVATDQSAAFPQGAMDALAKHGFLGLISASEVGGMGGQLEDAAHTVQRVAQGCASTAMVLAMHYCGTAVYESYGSKETRQAIAQGKHLTTLAFSEQGSRSHFWAPISEARVEGEDVILNSRKSWVTSAQAAHSFVWSSQSLDGEAVSLWQVDNQIPKLELGPTFDGLGLRGNDSRSIQGEGLKIPQHHRLGDDGGGFGIMMQTVLPHFNVLNSACSIGIMERALQGAIAHVSQTRYQHLDQSLAQLPTIRAYIAQAKLRTDSAKALWLDSIAAIQSGREDTMLRVLECKANSAESALEVTRIAMRVCGGAAYRKEVGVERCFRDAQAASVMAPTTDVLYDFIGKSLCDIPLF